jgi:hypothetical protein
MADDCTGCRRMTGSACFLSAAIPDDEFAVIAVELVAGGLFNDPEHLFRRHRIGWIFTHSLGMPRFRERPRHASGRAARGGSFRRDGDVGNMGFPVLYAAQNFGR